MLGDFIQSVGVFLAAIVIYFKVLNIFSPKVDKWRLPKKNSGTDLDLILKFPPLSARVELD